MSQVSLNFILCFIVLNTLFNNLVQAAYVNNGNDETENLLQQRPIIVKESEPFKSLRVLNNDNEAADSQPETKATLLAEYLIAQALAAEVIQKNQNRLPGGPKPGTSRVSSSRAVENGSNSTLPQNSTSIAPGTTNEGTTENILDQVGKILQNVATLNLVGVVDESLAVGGSPQVRNFVNGVLRGIFCNPISSLFNRCTPSAEGASSNNNNIINTNSLFG